MQIRSITKKHFKWWWLFKWGRRHLINKKNCSRESMMPKFKEQMNEKLETLQFQRCDDVYVQQHRFVQEYENMIFGEKYIWNKICIVRWCCKIHHHYLINFFFHFLRYLIFNKGNKFLNNRWNIRFVSNMKEPSKFAKIVNKKLLESVPIHRFE